MSSSEPASGGVLVISPADSQRVMVMQTFSRASPLSLGVVQIMVGVMVILFGIPMAASGYLLLLVYSGTFVWGALLYITAGALTVAAGKLTIRNMVKTALSLNISAAITSFISAVLLAVDASRVPEVLVKGMFGALVCFQLLMFAVSLTVVVFASLATCDCTYEDQLPTVFVNPGTASMAAQAPPTSYAPPAPSAQPATLQMQS